MVPPFSLVDHCGGIGPTGATTPVGGRAAICFGIGDPATTLCRPMSMVVETMLPPRHTNIPNMCMGTDRRDLPQLYLKDGTMYSVTDYWLVDNQLHFTMIEEGGTKSVEHVIGFDELDLQTTIDVNTQRGFRFVLRNEPLEQYLRDHPDQTPPLWSAPN